jgi:hypothetical protein
MPRVLQLVKWSLILVGGFAALIVVVIECSIVLQVYDFRYSHEASGFNEKDRAVVAAVRQSPTGNADAMRDSLAPFVDEPVLTKCRWEVSRYRGDRSIPKIGGKRPDKFTVTCQAEIKHCVTTSTLLLPTLDSTCWIYYHWYYADGLGVYKSEWDRGEY